MHYIPYGRQRITQRDIDMVVKTLQSDFLTQGPRVPEFETKVAAFCRAEYALAVNSATSALHIGCLALGLQEGDWLWTTPNTFVASANCGLYCGAQVDFVDIDPRTYNLCPKALAVKLEVAKSKNTVPKIVVVVHFGGEPCDMTEIQRLAQQYHFRIIEDASHAIGACYKDTPIGACEFSDITVFSFHPVKIITTGEGGMALTNQRDLAQTMEMLRSHGITRDKEKISAFAGPWYYEQQILGFNYRLTDLQAALGISQLEDLLDNINRRQALAQRYDLLLNDLPLILPYRAAHARSSLHLYVVLLDLAQMKRSYEAIFDSFRAQEIGVNLHYIPVHTQPYYQKLGFKKGDFPVAEDYASRAITLPLYPELSLEAQDRVVEVLHQAIEP